MVCKRVLYGQCVQPADNIVAMPMTGLTLKPMCFAVESMKIKESFDNEFFCLKSIRFQLGFTTCLYNLICPEKENGHIGLLTSQSIILINLDATILKFDKIV